MIKSVRVLNDRAVDQTLTLSEVSNGIVVKSITGLGPVKAEFVTTKKASGVGLNYSAKNIGSRNIVFSLGMSEVGLKSIEGVRRDIYDYFPIGEEVDLRFDTELGVRQIYGRVESVEPEIFTKEPSMQVSVICVDPYFVKYVESLEDGEMVAIHNTLVLPNTGSLAPIAYQGRVDTGFRITIEKIVASPVGSIMGHTRFIQDETDLGPNVRGFNIEDFDLSVITGSRLTLGDVITISSIQGKKSATLDRIGSTYNIIGAIKDYAGHYLAADQWPALFTGQTSTFKYLATTYDPTQLRVTLSWDDLIDGL